MGNNNIINTYFENLIKGELVDIGRCSNLVWLLFRCSRSEETWSLHLQCPCRFKKGDEILLSSGDMFVPASSIEEELLDWDVVGNNLFDEKAVIIISTNNFTVLRYSINKIGDLNIVFENGLEFQTFTETSVEEEQWRLFSKGSGKPHLVANSVRIDLE